MKTIKLFQTATGIKPFSEWLTKVKNKKDRARIRRRIDRLQLGHYGDFKQLKKGLYELRLFLVQVIEYILLNMAMKLSYCC